MTGEPNPGSNAAIDQGCECPILDNSHGWGYMVKGEFIIHADCPLHQGWIGE